MAACPAPSSRQEGSEACQISGGMQSTPAAFPLWSCSMDLVSSSRVGGSSSSSWIGR